MTEVNQVSQEQLRKGGFPEPVSLSGEVIKTFSQDQRRLLLNLAGLIENERILKGKINSIWTLVSSNSDFTTYGDDFLGKTEKDRLELKRVQAEIPINLKRAVDSGLGHLSLIQRHCQNFDVTL